MNDDEGMASFATGRRRLLRAMGAAGVAGLAGCSGGSESATAELVATLSTDVKRYDPTQASDTTSSKAFGLVYETLTSVDFDGSPQPLLATSIERLDAENTWRLSLREGVTFHDGSAFTAADVKATFERYEGTPRESNVFLWYDSSTVRDDHTLDVTLKRPYAPFETALANVPIVPEGASTGDVDLSEKPIGTGPYEFDSHEPDALFRLARNDDHWFEGSDDVPAAPPIEVLTFRIIVEQSAQLAALRSGDVDLINTPPAGAISDLKDNPEYTVTERLAGGFDVLIFPLATKPYTNRKVRKGIARLIPREEIIESVYDGIGQPAYAPVSPLLDEYADEAFQQEMRDEHTGYDPERAAELLREGFDELGLSTPHETRIVTNQNPERVKWCQLIQQELNATEFFDVGLEQFEWNTFTGKVLAEDSNQMDAMMALGWSAGWNPDNYVRNLFHSEQFTPNCCNAAHYSNPAVDSLLDEGLQTYDTEKRRELYREAQRKIVADTPTAFIRFSKRQEAYRSDAVSGFQTYPLDGEEFKAIYAPAAGVSTTTDT